MNTTNATVHAGPTGSAWKGLYRAGAVAGLLAAIVFRRSLGAEVSLVRSMGLIRVGPAAPPTAISDWFALLQSTPLLGLAWLDLFDLVEYALVGLIFLALFVALRRLAASTMLVATVCGLAGVIVSFATNQALAMLALSGQHAAAVAEVQKALYLAAGEALLASQEPGAALSLFLVLLAGLLISITMLRTRLFEKWAAWMGILANAFGLCYFIALACAPAFSFLPPTISAPFRLAWYVLIALKLFRLAKSSAPGTV